MRRRAFLATAGTAATVGVGRVAGQNDDPRTGSGTTDDPYIVGMYTEGSEFYFDPVGLYVEPGDTVRWVIESGSHSATAYTEDNPGASTRRIPAGADTWDSTVLRESGASFEYTVEQTGTYDYYCIPHKGLGMVGRIVCGEPGGPAEENEPPDDVGSGVWPPSKTITEKRAVAYPYIPESGGGGLPTLALGGIALFGLGAAYMISEYDLGSGRYDSDAPDDTETGLE